jgi:hypothetical protein
MAKIVEVRLHGLTCEFTREVGEHLEVTGKLKVESFDDPSVIRTEDVIFDFPEGPIRLRKGESALIGRDVRVTMATPSGGDPPGFGSLFIKFGGELAYRGLIAPERPEWATLHTNDVINTEPAMWHFYFGRNDRIVRADFSIVFVHPV